MTEKHLTRNDVAELSGLSLEEVNDVIDCRGPGYVEDLTKVAAAVGLDLQFRTRVTLAEAVDGFADALRNVTTLPEEVIDKIRAARLVDDFEQLAADFGGAQRERPTDPAELARFAIAHTCGLSAEALRRGQVAVAEEALVDMTGCILQDPMMRLLVWPS